MEGVFAPELGLLIMVSKKNIKHHKQKIGQPAGSLLQLKNQEIGSTYIELIEYNQNESKIVEITDFADIIKYKDSDSNVWINIKGKLNTDIVKLIQKEYNISLLTIEDLLDTTHYPKIEFFDNYIFFVLKKINSKIDSAQLEMQQISIILGKNYIISFQESTEEFFTPIKDHLLKNNSITKRSLDFLLYSLIDLIVDDQFNTLDQISEKMELIEDKLTKNPDESILIEINDLKKNISVIKSIHRAYQNIMSSVKKEGSELIDANLVSYFRDIEDHLIQLYEITELFREEAGHLKDFYFSSLNIKMAEIMKVLTIIATIFIPLTFIVGVYGMNFVYMPELKWHYGYFAVIALMIIIFISMIQFFKDKKWM